MAGAGVSCFSRLILMQVETIEQVAKLTPTISALLAGFSFTMIRGLMFHVEKPRLTTAALTSFIAAAGAMLVVTFNATHIAITVTLSPDRFGQPDYPPLKLAEDLARLTKWIFYGGLVSLFVGGGLLGWLHSKTVGILASLIMFAAACMILRTLLILPSIKV